MEPPESDGRACKMFSRYFAHIASGIVSLLLTIVGACVYMAEPSSLNLVVLGGSFQMVESLQGNLTIRFTLRAENPTGCSITYNNISATLAVRNQYSENENHFLSFPVTDFDVQQRTYVDTQVTATQLGVAENTTGVVLQLNGTMEESNHNSNAAYRCLMSTNNDDEACSHVKQRLG